MAESAPLPGETRSGRRFLRNAEGSAAVEFAIILNLLLLMIIGMLEFGLAFSMRQVIINASREGARYGIVFTVDGTGNRVAPINFPSAQPPKATIQDWVLEPASGGLGLKSILPADSNPAVTVGGTGATTGTTGNTLRVTVTCEYPFWVMNKFLPVLGDKMTLAGTTVMRVE
jgi:Flp pilus assembly protein TadG